MVRDELCHSGRGDIVMNARLLGELVDALTGEHAVDLLNVREEALRLYLNAHPRPKLDGAVALWRNDRISLSATVTDVVAPQTSPRSISPRRSPVSKVFQAQ
jgi:hypothetical protein